MQVAEVVGRALADCGVDRVFGVVGSGNFHVTNAMVAAGSTFVATRHEGGAATMADAYARMSGKVSAVSVHQGCGLTNAMTGIAEAAKSRTPMLVLAAEVTERSSNFFVDQEALAHSVGALSWRITSAATAVDDVVAAVSAALHQQRTIVLNLPLNVQSLDVPEDMPTVTFPGTPAPIEPSNFDLDLLIEALEKAERPVFVAGRGSRSPDSRGNLEALAARYGALVATSAVAHGLFNQNPWTLGVSGGFASPFAAATIQDSDLVVSWGCALNMWTTRHGKLISPDATVIQVDSDSSAIGSHRMVSFGVVGDVALTASRALDLAGSKRQGRRTAAMKASISANVRWRDVTYADLSGQGRIDPRTLTIALDDILPRERVISVDSGNFMGYPSMFLTVPDEQGFCFTQAFQSIGLGLATAIGAALAQPDRLPVAALGDGGALMGAVELDTVRRLGLPMVVIVYNDDAYSAEVHHFGPHGHPTDIVRFPPTDIAAIAHGYGFEVVTVRALEDLDPVRDWVAGERSAPLLIDAKTVSETGSWWLEEAFSSH